MKLFYSPAYVAAAESFDTTRKAGWIAESLASDPIANVEIVGPASLTFDEIAEVHAAAYVNAVISGEPRELAESQNFTWDTGMWPMVAASNGGAVAAAISAMSDGVAGSLSSGLHHARHETGAGFCTFNGLVIAAKRALHAGANSVLIIDLDAHCGGGTHSLIEADERISQLDVSVSDFDSYDPSERNSLDIVTDAKDYLETIRRRLDAIGVGATLPGLCIYNAGMDPDERCTVGGLEGIDAAMLAEREETVFQWCRARDVQVAFVIAGGYVGGQLRREDLVGLHRLTVSASQLDRTG